MTKETWALVLWSLCAACGNGSPDADADADLDADGEEDGDADGDGEPAVIWYDPRQVVDVEDLTAPRGWQLRRGIIHAHSIYSHDACDDEPFIDGVRNEQCFLDLRAAMCDTAQDFVFLTDHDNYFADHEFPDVLLYEDGDQLIERDGAPVANRVVCADGREVIVAAGTESGTMPIGLEHHVGDTPEARHAAYDDVTPEGVQALRDAGAIALVAHTEGWEVETLLDLPLDGIEIYNLHQNLMDNIGVAVNLLITLGENPDRVPDVELGLIALFLENDADLERWSRSVAVRRTIGVLATDVHRNSFPGPSPDGERLDSYRRMMHWFSNYVLVAEGDVDDLVLKEAIGHGRMYGAFDYLGYPEGFDFHAEAGDAVFEMGDATPAGEGVELRLAIPSVAGLDPEAPRPVIDGRILVANDGGWDVVSEGDTDLVLDAEPGVYRAEVRMVPEHLRPSLGRFAQDYLVETVWVYSNVIYVGMER
jgi:hypothetical protein